MSQSTLEQVRTLLSAAGLVRANEGELAVLASGYPAQRAGIERLYDLPQARYEDHGLIFRADPPLVDWRT